MGEHPSIATLKEYLRIPSVHPNIDYEPCVKFLRKHADILGLPLDIYGLPKKPVVIITWKGKNPSLPAIFLNSHMDVVPVVREKWTYDPFAAETVNGKIYARGAQDMKSVGIQYLEAVKILKKQGFQPTRNIILSFVPEEELGGAEGMREFALTKEFRKLNVGFSLDEGLASTADHFIIYNDERAKWAIKIHLRGNAGHGSLLLPDTAAEKMSIVLHEIYQRRAEEAKKIQGHPEFMVAMGDVTSINMTIVEERLIGLHIVMATSIPRLQTDTYTKCSHIIRDVTDVLSNISEVELFKGGVQNNVVPDHMSLEFDVRLAVKEDPEKLREWFEAVCKKAGTGVTLEFLRKSPQVPPTPVDDSNPFWGPYKSTLEKLGYKYVIAAFCGGTDSRFLREQGILALGLSPIKNTPVLLHDHDEYVPADQFLKGIDLYVELIKALTEVP